MRMYPEAWSVPSPKTSTLMSPSGDSERTSNSMATSRGSPAWSQSGLFFTPGDRSCPFTTRQWPPVEKKSRSTTAGSEKSWL